MCQIFDIGGVVSANKQTNKQLCYATFESIKFDSFELNSTYVESATETVEYSF